VVQVYGRKLLDISGTVAEEVGFGDGDLVIQVRLDRRRRRCCGICGARSPLYDAGQGRRRWRALDLGSTRCFLEAVSPRVRCRQHGVVVAAVPWASHAARSVRSFDDQVAWLAVHCSQSAVADLMRVSWRTVGVIIARVSKRLRQGHDELAGLRRIGIDEISYRKGQQ
jgi:transposase